MKGRKNELVACSKILVCYPGLPRLNCYRAILNKLTDEKKKKKKKKRLVEDCMRLKKKKKKKVSATGPAVTGSTLSYVVICLSPTDSVHAHFNFRQVLS